MEITTGYRENTPEPHFTWKDLLEAKVIKGWGYRECWAHYDWKVENDWPNKEHHIAYQELHNLYSTQIEKWPDNHQTFLIELKSGQRLFVLFHDWTIGIGWTARLERYKGGRLVNETITTNQF